MGEAASAYSDLAIVTSDNPRTEDPLAIIREIEKGIRTPKFTEAGDSADTRPFRAISSSRTGKRPFAAAIGLAEASDIVLIAGKGHEDYQIIGTEKFPFDDRQIAREELTRRKPGRKRIMTPDAPVLSAGEILKATGGALLRGGAEWSCRGISTDTRTLRREISSSPLRERISTATTALPQPQPREPPR